MDGKKTWSPAMDKFFGHFNTPKSLRFKANLTSTSVVNPSQPEVSKDSLSPPNSSTIGSLDSTEASAMIEASVWLEKYGSDAQEVKEACQLNYN